MCLGMVTIIEHHTQALALYVLQDIAYSEVSLQTPLQAVAIRVHLYQLITYAICIYQDRALLANNNS